MYIYIYIVICICYIYIYIYEAVGILRLPSVSQCVVPGRMGGRVPLDRKAKWLFLDDFCLCCMFCDTKARSASRLLTCATPDLLAKYLPESSSPCYLDCHCRVHLRT